MPAASLVKRFAKGWEAVTETGCWLWLGGLYHNGYGRLSLKKKKLRAHRVAYELFKGPIPKGMLVLHHCDVRCCVNPNHLYVGTDKDNARDRDRRTYGRKTAEHEYCF